MKKFLAVMVMLSVGFLTLGCEQPAKKTEPKKDAPAVEKKDEPKKDAPAAPAPEKK